MMYRGKLKPEETPFQRAQQLSAESEIGEFENKFLSIDEMDLICKEKQLLTSATEVRIQLANVENLETFPNSYVLYFVDSFDF